MACEITEFGNATRHVQHTFLFPLEIISFIFSVSFAFHGHVILCSITIVDEYADGRGGGGRRRRAAKVQWGMPQVGIRHGNCKGTGRSLAMICCRVGCPMTPSVGAWTPGVSRSPRSMILYAYNYRLFRVDPPTVMPQRCTASVRDVFRAT